MFLNLVDGAKNIEFVIDINPAKQNMYVPGTGHKIAAPDILKDYCPDVIILMNSIYQDEVQQTLNDLGVKATITLAEVGSIYTLAAK